MDSSKIKAVFIAVVALFAALYLGITAATAQFKTILWVVGGVGLTICLMLGRRIFLLLPFMAGLSLTLPLPGSFSTGLMAQGVVFGFLLLNLLMRRLPMRGGVSELEVWWFLLVVTVVQAYVRNPVGLNIFGSGSIGGKPYAIFAATTATALFLSLLRIDPKDLKLWVTLSFTGSILNFCIGLVGFFIPAVGYYLGASFSSDSATEQEAEEGQATRVAFVRNLSVGLTTWIASRRNPLKAIFHPLWLPLILFSIALAGASGYRSQIIQVGLIYFLGVCYWSGVKGVLGSILLGCLGLLAITILNLAVPLPANIQRSLSFLPGSWDSSVVRETGFSTDWRVDMWKEALFTDRWIENKIIGDGLGITEAEYRRMKALKEGDLQLGRGGRGMTVQQETMMINGNYHSGPVQTVRTTGYVGLIILVLAMIRLAVHAHRQILRTRGTEWSSVAMFLGLPIVATPLFWCFVFGSFSGGISGYMMGMAIVRLMEKNLPLPPYMVGRREAYVLDRTLKTAKAAG
ncbi:hypothetical protein [Haloferula sp.]|uniref:hypothetical protein n=1 Tax=Haloferula sp. TaxID=2497595 RepID=UPI00329C0078